MWYFKDTIPEGSRIANWTYEKPTHNLTPLEAIEIAKLIRKKYLALREKCSAEDSKQQLQLNYKDFSSPQCFPKLFEMCCNEKTTTRDFEIIEQLAITRDKLNRGEIKEDDANLIALKAAASAKN